MKALEEDHVPVPHWSLPHKGLNDTSAAIHTVSMDTSVQRMEMGVKRLLGLIRPNTWAGRREEIILFSSAFESELKPQWCTAS